MVKKGKSHSEISLDSIHYRVSVGSVCLELKPLTFALFAKLLEHKNEIVTADAITEEVWGTLTVAPDTLKQRVFLLRKALEEAGVEGCHVQSVRGFGYRLVVPDPPPAAAHSTTRWYWLSALGGTLVVALLAGYFSYTRYMYELPSNTRIVFWTSTGDSALNTDARALQQEWISRLSSNGKFQYLASDRDTTYTLSAQARLTHAALISRWVLYDSGGEQKIRMQIIEPKSATLLRSDILTVGDNKRFADLLSAQAEAIERILASATLPLTRDALNDTDHPAWDRLRDLAKGPESSDAEHK